MHEEEIILNRMLRGTSETAKSALSILYVKHAQPLFEFLYLMLGKNRELAMDLVHDTFLKVLEKRHHFDASRPFRPWLFRIASNHCKNEFRRQQINRQKLEELAHDYGFQPANEIYDNVQERLWELVDHLKPEHKEVVVLRYRTGLPVNEIAEITGIPDGTVKSRLFYGLKSLSELTKTIDLEYINN